MSKRKNCKKKAVFVLCTFNKRLKELREENNLSQEEFAVKLGMNGKAGRSTINNWETGGYNIKADKLIKIAQAFGVTVDWLLGQTDTPSLDIGMQSACKTTGLSEKAISNIKESTNSDMLSTLLESDEFMTLLDNIAVLKFQSSLIEDANTYVRECERTGYDVNFEPISFTKSYDENMLRLRLNRFEIEKAFSTLLERLVPTAELISESKSLMKGAGLYGEH